MNTNCLEGMKCPKCGNEDMFTIVASCVVEVTDDGTEDATDFEWDDNSRCSCSACNFSARVSDYKPKQFTEICPNCGEETHYDLNDIVDGRVLCTNCQESMRPCDMCIQFHGDCAFCKKRECGFCKDRVDKAFNVLKGGDEE